MKQGPEALIPEKVPVPQVRPGWSLIRIRTFGLNHSEIFTRQGLSPSATFPRILGIECTGELGGQWYLDDHFDPIMDLPANGYLTSFCSGNVDQARLQALSDEIARTHADLGPAKVFPFSELREAHAWLGTERSGGKAVVVL